MVAQRIGPCLRVTALKYAEPHVRVGVGCCVTAQRHAGWAGIRHLERECSLQAMCIRKLRGSLQCTSGLVSWASILPDTVAALFRPFGKTLDHALGLQLFELSLRKTQPVGVDRRIIGTENG